MYLKCQRKSFRFLVISTFLFCMIFSASFVVFVVGNESYVTTVVMYRDMSEILTSSKQANDTRSVPALYFHSSYVYIHKEWQHFNHFVSYKYLPFEEIIVRALFS